MNISLQPKQKLILEKMRFGRAVVLGVGGGRGAAKSGGADRIELILMGLDPGHVDCLVMRNYDQVRKYHIEPMLRQWPELEEHFNKSESRLVLPCPGGGVSQLDFSYAESLADVERRFRSGNYRRIIVDQAEQFTEPELREMRKANRSPGDGKSRMLLLHNMGGIGISTLSKWFNTKEFYENEDPDDYDFVKVNPWDNVEWAREALKEDGLTPKDYYSWTDLERKEYCATRTQYGKSLTSDDPSIVARDWDGDWNALEGAYFGHSFDRANTLTFPEQIAAIQKPWDKHWMSQDWGKSHFCCTLWHSMSLLSPSEVEKILGWEVRTPLKVIVTYRRKIVNEMTSAEVGAAIVKETPVAERPRIKDFYLSPDAFGERDSANTIADNQAFEMRRAHMPQPQPADTDRPGGWQLMSTLLMNTKTKGRSGDTVWLISSECPELLNSIPLLMKDPKDIDVVLKTDKGQARLEQDVSESARYGLKSFLGTVAKPFAVELQEKVHFAYERAVGDVATKNTAAHMAHIKALADKRGKQPWRRQY